MNIKIKTLVQSQPALARLLSAHAPTAASTYKLAKLRRAVNEHIGPDSPYQDAYGQALKRHGEMQPNGTVTFADNDSVAALEAEIKPLWAESIELQWTPMQLAALDELKTVDEKALALSADELAALEWLIEVPA